MAFSSLRPEREQKGDMTTGKDRRAYYLSNLGGSPTQSHEVGPDLLGCETLLQGTWEMTKISQRGQINQSADRKYLMDTT